MKVKKKIQKKKNRISEATGVDNSPGVKGYSAYTPTEKWSSQRKKLSKVIKKTTDKKTLLIISHDSKIAPIITREINVCTK